MRKVFAIVAALLGGYLLWEGIKFGRVLLIIDDARINTPMLVITLVLVGLGIAFLGLGWWLFRKRPAPSPTPPQNTPPGP